VVKGCWGCGRRLHKECAKGSKWGPGPTHCEECWEFFRAGGVRECVLDTALMHQVVVGVEMAGVSDITKQRCVAAAVHFRWDGGRLFLRGQDGEEREVVPWRKRKQLVRDMAAQLGFPGGKRLY
jgi:hypothetical protein